MPGQRKTIIFEKKFGVNIKDFSTTEEIDEFIKNNLGIKELRVEEIETDFVTSRGNIIPIIKKADLDDIIDQSLDS